MPKGNRPDALLKTYVKKYAIGMYNLENNNHGELIELLVPSSLKEFTK